MPSDLARFWTLDSAVAFLNHGSFGACPRPVLEAQQRLRERLERQPVQFLVRDLEVLLDDARSALAAFLGADPEGLVFVTNATTGVNAVLRSLALAPGDQVLVTDHAYNACRNALDFAAAAARAEVVVVPVPFPLASADAAVEAVLARATPRTRLALLDHVTSPTGLVLPIERLALDLGALGAAYYAGNCHKWLCAPKGAGFLHVRRDRQGGVRPVVISHGANSPRTDRSRLLLEFDWTGSHDPTAYLCVPEAIRFLGGLLPGGWPELIARNRQLALEARRILCDALDAMPPAPEEMVGALAAVPLPDGADAPLRSPLYVDPLQDVLLERYRIEVPIVPWPAPPKRLVRVSCQAYNARDDYERLATALRELTRGG